MIMGDVISIRVPSRLKEKMEALKDRVKWSKEIRKFIEEKVKELWREKVLEEIDKVVEQLPEVPKGTVTKYVREDRDSN